MTEVIADLPRDDRPRERLLMHGAATLSDAELLAILFGSGMRGKNAIQLAREVLGDGLPALRRRELSDVAATRGVGNAKAARLAAAFEIARRLASEPDGEPTPFDSDVLGRSLLSSLSHQSQEHLGAVFLDSRRRILRQRDIYVGTINSALVSTRDVIRHALVERATGVVLFHNHPSGSPLPSAEDLLFTRKIKESLRLCDIDLVDHLVIGSTRWHSMKREGEL